MAASWERQEYDTNKSYAAFLIYLRMPPSERSLAKVSAQVGHTQNHTVEEWSRGHDWQRRIRDYDSYVNNSAITVQTATLAQAQAAQIQNWALFSIGAMQLIGKQLQRFLEAQLEGERIDPLDIHRLVKAAAEVDTINRRSLGMPTSFKSDWSDMDQPDGDEEVYIIGKTSSDEED